MKNQANSDKHSKPDQIFKNLPRQKEKKKAN
jgi:hypothetical protein